MHAIRLRGGDVSFRLFADAAHSFDRETALESLPDAAVAPNAQTGYIADDGAMVHPATGASDPSLLDRDLMIYAMEAGFGAKGATIVGMTLRLDPELWVRLKNLSARLSVKLGRARAPSPAPSTAR